MSALTDRKKQTKSIILQYMMNHDYTTKAELAGELKLSMPTVINNTNELIADGFVVEVGELESTGGRKPKRLSINRDKKYAVGVEISKNHVSLLLINMKCEVVKENRSRIPFDQSVDYYRKLAEKLEEFLSDQETSKILGVGFALPGIVNEADNLLWKSHALNLENYSLGLFYESTTYPVHFMNDANAALIAELPLEGDEAVYLSLNQTLGGAIYSDGKIKVGKHRKAGEFGHMILHPGGKKCYCGKCGCSDAYCAASVLTRESNDSMEDFFEALNQEIEKNQKSNGAKPTEKMVLWDTYLENLAILITNLRMAYDNPVILGGDVSGFLEEQHLLLGEKLLKYNLFDRDISYISYSKYKKQAPAIGTAKMFFYEYIRDHLY